MNNTKPQRQAGRISRPQLIAIIAIVLIGLGASAWLLKSAPSAPAGEAAEEGHGHGHDEAKGHDDGEHHDEKNADAGHDEAKGHDDKEHHEKPGAHAEHDTLEGEGGEGKGASSPAGADKHVEGEEEPVQLNAQQIAAGGIKVEAVGPASIRTTMQLSGEIKFNEDRTAHVVPRVAGVVEAVSASLGQQVKKGQVLATISSVLLSEQRSELQAAQKRLTLAQTTHAREKKLFEEKISRAAWITCKPCRRCGKPRLRP
jgi:cobalt-zinc-cadmium efflux system membrane fusion protein